MRRRWVAAKWHQLCQPLVRVAEDDDAGIRWLVADFDDERSVALDARPPRSIAGRRIEARHGHADVRPIHGDQRSVRNYVAKYVTKGGVVDLHRL